MQDDGLTAAERELEIALGHLRPAPTGVNRDRIMFLAGQASGRRHRRVWQGVSCCLGIVAVALLLSRPTSHTSQVGGPYPMAITAQDSASATSTSDLTGSLDLRQAGSRSRYVHLRRMVRDRGLDALPSSKPVVSPNIEAPRTRENLEEILSST